MSRLFISAAHKSSGKTTVSIGLCAALKQRGNIVQSFKKGPDYIDPYWLAQATGRNCYNLDFYTMQRDEILTLIKNRTTDSDITLIEGNKGLYDGLDLDGSNSNAALATLTRTPVILVLNSRGMTRGIAPLILGYQAFDKDVSIRGVILNRLGGSRHESKLRNVIEHYTDVQVVGAIHNDNRFNIDERHLGLVPGHEDPFCTEKIHLLSQAVREQVNLEQIIDIAETAPAIPEACIPAPLDKQTDTTQKVDLPCNLKVGLIRHAAFGFYYPDDIEAIQQSGAEIIEINPCTEAQLPELDALFIGGGFPETHLEELEANSGMRQSIYYAIENGLPTYAECGGLMYLARSIEWHGKIHQMVGSVDADIVMEKRPQGRGYVQLEETPDTLWPQIQASTTKNIIHAHEFHYSRFKTIDYKDNKNVKFAFRVLRGTGITGKDDGYIYKNLLACYTHQRTSRDNPWTHRFIEFARQNKTNNN